jgi:hypothetical protein
MYALIMAISFGKKRERPVGIFKRLFGSSDPEPKASKRDEGDLAVTRAVDLLRLQLDIGGALPGGKNRQRLEEPYARG